MGDAFLCPFNGKACPARNSNTDWDCPLKIKRHERSEATCAIYEIAAQVMRIGDYVFEIDNKLKG